MSEDSEGWLEKVAEGERAAHRLLPAILADARSVGMTLDVQLRLDEWGVLEVLVSYEPGRPHESASNGGLPLPVETDADLLVRLADEVQEVTMERDQVNVFVWPVCPTHQLGGHANVVAGVAVWSCRGSGGHVLAPIGELSGAGR